MEEMRRGIYDERERKCGGKEERCNEKGIKMSWGRKHEGGGKK